MSTTTAMMTAYSIAVAPRVFFRKGRMGNPVNEWR